jgi:hypothetical protein
MPSLFPFFMGRGFKVRAEACYGVDVAASHPPPLPASGEREIS